MPQLIFIPSYSSRTIPPCPTTAFKANARNEKNRMRSPIGGVVRGGVHHTFKALLNDTHRHRDTNSRTLYVRYLQEGPGRCGDALRTLPTACTRARAARTDTMLIATTGVVCSARRSTRVVRGWSVHFSLFRVNSRSRRAAWPHLERPPPPPRRRRPRTRRRAAASPMR